MGAKDSKVRFSGETQQFSNTPTFPVGSFFTSADPAQPSYLITVYDPSTGVFVGYLPIPYFLVSATTSSRLNSASVTTLDPLSYGLLFLTITSFFVVDTQIRNVTTGAFEVIIRFTPTTTSQDPIELSSLLLEQNFSFQGDEISKSFSFVFPYLDPNRQCVTYRISPITITLSKSPDKLGRVLEDDSEVVNAFVTYTNGPDILPVFNAINLRNLSNNLGTFDFAFPRGQVVFSTPAVSFVTPCFAEKK